jgi:hypothetical protein
LRIPGEADSDTRFFTPEQKTPDGWRLPLHGNLVSYRYFRPLDFLFEVWLGGDHDVTVRLERPFTYGYAKTRTTFDPRTRHKSELAPLLRFGEAKVSKFVVSNAGELSITFSDRSRLIASAAEDGHAWALDVPVDGLIRVKAVPGQDAVVTTGPSDPWGAYKPPDHSYDLATTSAGLLTLPIRGRIDSANASGVSIELIVPIKGGGDFCLHFGGGVEIADAGGHEWSGTGDAEDQTTLGPMLSLVGKDVVDALVEADGRLRLSLGDDSRLTAAEDRWEAHWPDLSAPYEERWVPREGPNIP